jgi:hypothetical protein
MGGDDERGKHFTIVERNGNALHGVWKIFLNEIVPLGYHQSVDRWYVLRPTTKFPERLEAIASELGLTSKQYALRGLPENIHWHFRKPGLTGTLEATWLAESGEAWLSAHRIRGTEWVFDHVQLILAKLDSPLR